MTNKLSKKSKIAIVWVTDADQETSSILSIVDTLGAFDSDGNDNQYNNMMTYFQSMWW